MSSTFVLCVKEHVLPHIKHCISSPQGRDTSPGTPSHGVVVKPCIEMRTLARQYSTASSSDTYTSCTTHLPTSPNIKGYNLHNNVETQLKNNIYVNPLGESHSFTSLNCTYSNVHSASKDRSDRLVLINSDNDNDANDVFVERKLKTNNLADKRARWTRVNSQPPLQTDGRYHSNASCARADSADRPQGGSLKRHRSESSHERHLHFGEVMERTFSSTDNIHDMQALPKAKFKFRKAVSLASKLHGSPSTGRKLANYHLISNPKSGMFCLLILYFLFRLVNLTFITNIFTYPCKKEYIKPTNFV